MSQYTKWLSILTFMYRLEVKVYLYYKYSSSDSSGSSTFSSNMLSTESEDTMDEDD